MRPQQAIHNWQMDHKTGGGGQLPEQKPEYVPAFRTLLRYARPHAWSFAIVFASTLLAIAADLLQPYLMKVAIDDNLLSGAPDYRALLVICAIYLALSLASFLFTYIQSNVLQYACQRIVERIRKQLFEHILKLPMSYFDRTSSGALITHVSSDTEALNQFFNQVLLSLFRDSMTVLFILLMLFQLDTTLALYCLLLLPVIAGIAMAFRSLMRANYQLARTRLSRMVAFVAENLAGISLIQAFHQQKEQERQFRERNDAYFRANLREIRTNVLFGRTFDLVGSLAIALVVWVGGRAVFGQQLEFGILYAFIAYIRQLFQPISTITQQWNMLQSATVAVSRIWSVFAIRPSIVDSEAAKPLNEEDVRGEIEFRNATFGYAAERPIIRGFHLHIGAGEMVGVVGATGAGKSTLISLLCRLYDVNSGEICLDGVDIRRIPLRQLHRFVGLVQQEPFLYSGTIVDNVRLFDPDISREQVMAACELVGADPLIRRLPGGYDTVLSERGSGLSTGERQLISFARIIVFQPKVFILDEASANLDSHTEQLIRHALQVVSGNRTSIVIAHRLSTVMQAERIIVMSRGEIVEQGTHEQLLRRRGHYYELYRHSIGRSAGQETG